MDGARDQLLAGAGLPGDEHRGIGRGDLAHLLHHRLQALGAADEVSIVAGGL